MLSAKRIVEIFRTRGGGEDFINPAGKLCDEQLSYLRSIAEGEPIIAKVSPASEWLVVTKSHLVVDKSGNIFRVPLTNIDRVEITKKDWPNHNIKKEGGSLDLALQDGASLCIAMQPGGPYFGLLNVLMRIATINNRKFRTIRNQEGELPATNDERSTTQ